MLKSILNTCSIPFILLVACFLFSCQPKTVEKNGGLIIEVEIIDSHDTLLSLKAIDILKKRIAAVCEFQSVELSKDKKHIFIKLPLKKDPSLFKNYIFKKGNFEIVEVYNLGEIEDIFKVINNKLTLNENYGLFEKDSLLMSYQIPLSGIFTLLDKQNSGFYELDRNMPVIGYSLPKDTSKVNSVLKHKEIVNLFPFNFDYRWQKGNNFYPGKFALIAIKKPLDYKAITSNMIKIAKAKSSVDGYLELSINLKQEYAGLWTAMTRRNIGFCLVMKLNDEVVCYPKVNTEIINGKTSISGLSSDIEANAIASILNNGELPIDVKINKIELVKR